MNWLIKNFQVQYPGIKPTNVKDPVRSSSAKLVAGGIILAAGFLSPVLIPLVTDSGLPAGWKATITGLLIFGIPEGAMILAVAIMGKEGYQYFKEIAGKLLKKYGPPDQVSRNRYRLGLVLFVAPLLLGWLLPYLNFFWPALSSQMLPLALAGDLLLLSSLLVLGGDFWDKLRSLFVAGAKADFPESSLTG